MSKSTTLVAMLDLMCCSMGGAFLLLLMVASSNSAKDASGPQRLVVVRAARVDGQAAEIGLEVRRPNGQWSRIDETFDNAQVFAARSSPDPVNGGEAFVLLRRPEPGTWAFRAYLVDFPAGLLEDADLQIALSVHGDRLRWQPPAKPRPMRHPGDLGPEIEVEILPEQ